MKKKLTFYALVLTGVTFILSNDGGFFQKHSCQQYQQIERYREVQEVFDAADVQTLIIFDVDNTLIIAADGIISRETYPPLWFSICAALKHPSLIFKNTREWLGGIVGQQAERFVLDPDIVRYIAQLRKQKCNVIALSLLQTGSVGTIKSLQEWRARMLQSFGIDFQGQFEDAVFSTLPKYNGNYPCLCKGVLCTNQQPKGAALGAFLDYYHLKPGRIIAFDDFVYYPFLDSIAQECARRGIPFTGYQVVTAKKFIKPWNNRRAHVQLDYVMKHGQWLSDKQADALLVEKNAA